MTTKETTIDAVIFDFDGTLVDTMPVHFEAYRRTFAEMNLELTREAFYESIGGNARETIPKLLAGRAAPLDLAAIHQRKKQIVSELLTSEPIPVLPAAQLLSAFAGRLPIALASSGSRPGIELVLERFGWRDYFSAIVTGEDVPNGKPAPDLFLRAAEKLGVPAKTCLVFEDTTPGVEAAAAAGMRVFDVRGASAPEVTIAPSAAAKAAR